MNIEEAKKIVDNLSVDSDELWKIPMITAHKVKALLDTLDQPKPKVPQFVADWIEEHKQMYSKWDEESKSDFVFRAIYDLFRFGEYLSTYDFDISDELSKWTTENAYKFITAILFGYTVKKEKLYTVEIPNPNSDLKIILVKVNKKLKLIEAYEDQLEEYKNIRNLTEREIRKDFDWAWQFREEVVE